MCGTLPVMTNRYLVDISWVFLCGFASFFKEGRPVGGRKGFRGGGEGCLRAYSMLFERENKG